MKELSIGDKAKAYDEVREKIAIRFGSNVADEIFSQFEMSEDERIRNWLIETIKQVPNDSIEWETIDKSSVLAWLEKQGEQKSVIEIKTPEESLGIDSNTYNKIVDECIYGEKKPADKPKFKVKYAGSEYNVFKTKDIAGVTFYGIEDEPNHIDYVKADNCEIISDYGIKESGLSFPTKPVMFSTWSEEDDEHLERILKELGNQRQRPINSPYLDKIESDYNWLKSLRTQNRWKPSDEQMKKLRKYCQGNILLTQLYQDLKKLK